MIQFASEMFIARKNPRTSFKEYDDAQRWYVTNHSWNTTLTAGRKCLEIFKSRLLPETNIHRHMGYLFGFPDSQDGPFFTLYNFGGKVVCMSSIISGDSETPQPMSSIISGDSETPKPHFDFKPMSVFPSFSRASLTGLVLFGLDLYHTWIIDESSYSSNCTTAHYIANIVDKHSSQVNTGLTLETLTHLAVIQASKTGGVYGCSVQDFLQSLVRELTPLRKIKNVDLLPAIHFDKDPFPGHTIPLLSPMATTSWSAPLFSCLKSLMSSQSTMYLGSYQQTMKNDRADGVAFYQKSVADTIEIPISPEESLDTLKNLVIDDVMDTKIINVHAPRFSKCFGLKTGDDLPGIAFVVECKQWSTKLQNSDVRKIVTDKFSKHKSCSLFFIIAMDIGVEILNISGYRSWVLRRSKDDGRRRREPFTLKLLNTGPAQFHQKCLIIIPLKVIWGPEADRLEENLKRQMAT
jgi:hypothetical protein